MRRLLQDIRRRCIELSGQSLQAALPSVHDDVHSIATSLDWASETIPSPDQPLRVVLLGRTQAGKSTLFSYLTGSDASAVGHGAQRHTQTVITESMLGRPDIVIVDTPGVGALDGDEDREIALDAARHADLAVWVATNNAQPTETAAALSQVAEWGVPMLLVLNCREDLTGDKAVEQFLAYPESTFADLDGHLRRLARFLDPHGQRPLEILAVQAAAALLGARTSPRHEALLRASGVDALGAAIRAEADRHGDSRRTAAIVDVARRALVDAARRLTGQAEALELWADTQRSALTDFDKRAARLIADAELRVQREIGGLFGRFDDWADRQYHGKDSDIEAMWDADIRQLGEDADGLLRAAQARLRRRIGQLDDEVVAAWSKRIAVQLAKPRRVPLSGVAPRGIEAAARATLTAAGGYLGAVIGEALWLAGGAIPGAVIGGFVGEWVGSHLLLRRRQLNRRRTTLHEWVRSELEAHRAVIDASWRSTLESLQQGLAACSSERHLAAQRTMDLAGHASVIAEAARCGATSADRCLLRTLLQLAGRDRLADLVTTVHRTPGFACLTPIPDASLREFVLWPPAGMIEHVRPIPSGDEVTDFRRMSYALDAGRRHVVLVPEGESIRAFIPEQRSPELLAAEAALASTVLDLPISLISTTAESTEAVA